MGNASPWVNFLSHPYGVNLVSSHKADSLSRIPYTVLPQYQFDNQHELISP